MKASAPTAEFCLLGGDLAENGTPAQLTLIKDAFSALGIPFHSVVGNHDYLSVTNRSAYERIFPEQINYSFTHRGWQIIGLDSSEGNRANETRIFDTTLGWLDQNIPKLESRRPTILFTHFPLGESVFARPLNTDDLLQRCYGQPPGRFLRSFPRVHPTPVLECDHHYRQMLRPRSPKPRRYARERLVRLPGRERRN
jgi:Calcineurin-like phosphoesterase